MTRLACAFACAFIEMRAGAQLLPTRAHPRWAAAYGVDQDVWYQAARSHVVGSEIEETSADRNNATQIEPTAPVEIIEVFLSSESLDAE